MLRLVITGHFAGLPRQLDAQAEQTPLVRNISLIRNLTTKGALACLSWGRCKESPNLARQSLTCASVAMYNRYNRPRWRCDYAVVYAGMFTILRPRPGSLGLCLAAILFARDVCVRAVNETTKLFARPEVPRRMCVLFAGLICQSPSQSRSCPTCRYPLPGDQTTCFPRNFALEDAIAHLNEQVRPLPLFPRVTRISSQSHSPLPVWRY